MSELGKDGKANCEDFLNELEGLPVDRPGGATAEELSRSLPPQSRGHAASCASCQAALEDFAEARRVLRTRREESPQPGPFFMKRVMAAINAQEAEIEEEKNGFWISIRRIAPRLAAFAAVLLVLCGTWAFEVRRAEHGSAPVVRPADGLFETAPSAPPNDDVIASANEER
jgi:hypothetical protein